MLYNLHEMFGGQGRQARQQAVRQFMNCRMKAGTPVRNHMMLMLAEVPTRRVVVYLFAY